MKYGGMGNILYMLNGKTSDIIRNNVGSYGKKKRKHIEICKYMKTLT